MTCWTNCFARSPMGSSHPRTPNRWWPRRPRRARRPMTARQGGGMPDADGRAVRIQVTEAGRTVVNLRVPMSWTGLTSSVPGLSGRAGGTCQRGTSRSGERGRILDIRDDEGGGVDHQHRVASGARDWIQPRRRMPAAPPDAATPGSACWGTPTSGGSGSPRPSPSSAPRSACWPCPSWPSCCSTRTRSRSRCWGPSSSCRSSCSACRQVPGSTACVVGRS